MFSPVLIIIPHNEGKHTPEEKKKKILAAMQLNPILPPCEKKSIMPSVDYTEPYNHKMVWAGREIRDPLLPTPLLWAGSPATRPGCLKLLPSWIRTLPGTEHFHSAII